MPCRRGRGGGDRAQAEDEEHLVVRQVRPRPPTSSSKMASDLVAAAGVDEGAEAGDLPQPQPGVGGTIRSLSSSRAAR